MRCTLQFLPVNVVGHEYQDADELEDVDILCIGKAVLSPSQ